MVLIGWARLCSRPVIPLVRSQLSGALNFSNKCSGSRCSTAVRFYCDQKSPPQPPPPPPLPPRPAYAKLMNFPPVVWPSFFLSVKNWIYTTFIIKPHLDPEFSMQSFVESSKQAVQVISTALHESDFNSLQELVSEEAYSELYYSLTQMSLADRGMLAIDKKDIYLSFPYQIGIIFSQENDRRWVEITMVYHSLKGFNVMKERGESLPLTFGPASQEHMDNLFVCNYRFIREYTKGIKNSSWIVNIVNHFRECDYKLQV